MLGVIEKKHTTSIPKYKKYKHKTKIQKQKPQKY